MDEKNIKPINEFFNRINLNIGTMNLGLGMPDKADEFRTVLNSLAQDVKDLKNLLVQSGQYDQNHICLNCFIKKHHLAKGIYSIPFSLMKVSKCSQCGKTIECRIDLEV